MRAPFGSPPLVEPIVRRLGLLLARHLREERAAKRREPSGGSEHPHVVLGGDTRSSTPVLWAWLAEGLAAGGASVDYAGVVPTPAVAFLVRSLGADAGIAVSASHNLPPDNGIKLVGADGFKWPTSREHGLERQLVAGDEMELEVEAADEVAEAVGACRGESPNPNLTAAYLASLRASLAGERPLTGLQVALDTANGAASAYAAGLFASLGADADPSHDRPDGENINRGCGSTHPEAVAAHTLAAGAGLGVAFDGDADRAILVDEQGEIADGDALLYVWASALDAAGELPGHRIVATTMSNLGLEVALARRGIALLRCDVGDRVVVETMRAAGVRLGGEQSGHLVDLTLATTGDGMLTALQIAGIMARTGQPLSTLTAGFVRFPQLLRNVGVARKPPLDTLPNLAALARDVEERLGREGRLVLRYSGTESLCRIMLEGPDRATIESMADELAGALAADLA